MATMNSGLGGSAGYGENSFKTNGADVVAFGTYDDASVQVDITSVFGAGGINYFGTNYTDIWINSNGLITFNSADTTYNPSGVSSLSQPAIAPFWSDIDIDKGGDIYWDLDPAAGTVTVTWLNVRPYDSGNTNTNSFQIVLTDKGDGDFDIQFTYETINWANGNSGSSIAATAGITDGGSHDFDIEGSGTYSDVLTWDTTDFVGGGGNPSGIYTLNVVDGSPTVFSVEGTASGDAIDISYVDADGHAVTAGDDAIFGGAGNDTIDGDAGSDTIDGGAGADTFLSGSATTSAPSYTNAGNGANLTGTTGQDYFSFDAGTGDSATVRFSNSAGSGDGDGVADYVVIETTNAFNALTIGDFDMGTDKIVLQEAYTGVAHSSGSGYFDVRVTYANSNEQWFRLFTDSGTFDANQVFTTTMPAVADPDADSLSGGDDADTFVIANAPGNDTIVGGEGGSDSDLIDMSGVTVSGVTVTYAGDELGTSTDGTHTLTFSEIERLTLTDQNDALDASATTQGVDVDAGDGADTLSGGFGGDTIDGGAGNDSITGGENLYEVPAFRMGTDFTLNSGTFEGGGSGTTLTINQSGAAYFVDNDGVIGGDSPNETFTDSGQLVVIDGVAYEVLFDDVIEFQNDATGDIYTFAVLDVDLDGSGQSNEAGEDGTYLIQTGGPTIPDGANLTFNALLENNPAPFDLAGYEVDGAGDDSLDGGTGNDTLEAGTGQDTLEGGSGEDSLFGGTGHDLLDGGSDNDSLEGGAGDDTLMANFGSDAFVGGDDLDTYQIDGSDVSGVSFNIDLGAGTDGYGNTYSGIETVVGGSADDVVQGDTVSNRLEGRGGNDSLTGGQGSDTLLGGVGSDTIDGGVDDDLVVGDQDSLTFNATGTDGVAMASNVSDFPTDALSFEISYTTTATGSNYPLVSYASSGSTNAFVLEVRPDEDLRIHINDTSVDTGLDMSVYADGNPHTLGVTWDSASGALEVYVDASNVYSGTFATGETLDQGGTLVFGQEQDAIGGGFSASQIFEGTFHGAAVYSDVRTPAEMQGSNGNAVARDLSDTDLVANWVPDGNTGTLTDLVGNHTMTLSGDVAPTNGTGTADDLAGGDGSDALFGGAGDDTITGGAGSDYLEGGDGADLLLSGTGDDTLVGGAGDDTLKNSSGDDSLVGGSGNDSIVATIGDDTLEGEDGADTLIGGIDDDSLVGGAGDDSMIGDFESGGLNEAGRKFAYEFYELDSLGSVSTLADAGFTGADNANTPDGQGVIDSTDVDAIDAAHGGNLETFAVKLVTTLTVTTGGTYDFTLSADDGAKLFIDGVEVINHDGVHGYTTQSGSASLTSGEHLIEIIYFESNGAEQLGLTISGPDTGGSPIALENANVAVTFDDTLEGGTGSDTLYGGIGDDQMSGGDDADRFIIEDGYGQDTIVGGEGGNDNDIIDLSALGGPVTVSYTGDEEGTLTDGTDTITFSEIEGFVLTDQDDRMIGSANDLDAYIDAGDGNDTVSTDSGDDTVLGGGGNDSITTSFGDDSVIGGDGDDYISTGYGRDTVDAGAGDDTVWAGRNDGDLIYAGDDSDLVYVVSEFGTDTVYGGEGGTDTDTLDFYFLDYTDQAITITFSGNEAGTYSDGLDTSEFYEFEAFILTEQNDTANAASSAAAQSFDGREGDDTLIGGSGDDTLIGGEGADSLVGNAGSETFVIEDSFGNDTIDGGADDDVIDLSAVTTSVTVTYGGSETGTITHATDTLSFSDVESIIGTDQADSFDARLSPTGVSVTAGDGADTITGGVGADSIDAGSGSDRIVLAGNFGNDTIIGGEDASDTDIIDLSNLVDPVTVSFTGPEAGTITDGTNWITFSQIEAFALPNGETVSSGTTGDVLYVGDEVANFEGGGTGDDTLVGGGGDDGFGGGDGDDVIYGDGGNDGLGGNGGNDTIYGGDGNDGIGGEAGNDELHGGDGDDGIGGGDGNDLIYGGDGNDGIGGDADNDTIYGDAGNDTIGGHDGDDSIYGGTGDDSIGGNTGNDRLEGGDGDDIFVYDVGDGLDTIADFNTGNTGGIDDGDATNNDRIDLSGYYEDIWELRADFDDDGILNQSNTLNDSGRPVDYSDNTQFGAGEGLVFEGATRNSFAIDNTGVVCFTTGTAIRTPTGARLIETLNVGDLVDTMDNGPQRIIWMDKTIFDPAALAANPKRLPILIKKGTLGATRDLLVSRQHSMLVDDTLVRAIQLTDQPGIRIAHGKRAVSYVHLMFEAHQIIFAENTASESFYPGPWGVKMLGDGAKASLQRHFPAYAADLTDPRVMQTYGPKARPEVSRGATRGPPDVTGASGLLRDAGQRALR